MNKVPESRLTNKCHLSERFAANIQPATELLEAEWHHLRSTMDPYTEVLLRQAHEALAKLYEFHVYPGARRRS